MVYNKLFSAKSQLSTAYIAKSRAIFRLIHINTTSQKDDEALEKYPFLFYLSLYLSAKSIYFRMTSPQVESFIYHHLLHHKYGLLEEKEVLASVKRILKNFSTSVNEGLSYILPAEGFQVKKKYYSRTRL